MGGYLLDPSSSYHRNMKEEVDLPLPNIFDLPSKKSKHKIEKEKLQNRIVANTQELICHFFHNEGEGW